MHTCKISAAYFECEAVTRTGVYGGRLLGASKPGRLVRTSKPGSVVELAAKETPWRLVNDDEKRPTGSWKQDVEILSTFSATCAPSTKHRLLIIEIRERSGVLAYSV